MADLKFWEDLTEGEQADFAKKVADAHPQGFEELARLAEKAGIDPDPNTLPTVYELEHWTKPEVKRCCRTCAHCVITTKECYEGGTTDIGDLDRELTTEDCSAWTPREGSASPGADQLFSYSVDMEKCPQCNWQQGIFFVLAPNQAEADNIRRNGGGLCGACMCDTIIETHAEVRTQPAFVNGGKFYKAHLCVRDGENEYGEDIFITEAKDFQHACQIAELYTQKYWDYYEDETPPEIHDSGWYEDPTGLRAVRLEGVEEIPDLSRLLQAVTTITPRNVA